MLTSVNFSFYSFTFLMRSVSNDIPVLIYHFKSPKTKQWYIVRVEEYPHHFFGVKFYLKSDSNNPHKYNRLSGLNEPRAVINTCIAIMFDVEKNNPQASFGFIGANITGEGFANTKRFRVYRRILTTYFSEDIFYHYQVIEQSAYALVRRTELEKNTDMIEQISTYFSENYTNFD